MLEKLNRIFVKGEEKGRLRHIYDSCMMLVIIVSIVPLMFVQSKPWFVYVEYITVTLFVFDYIARWITAPFRLKKGVLSYFIYPFMPMAMVDLLSIVPVINLLDSSFKLFRLTRLLKIVRVFKLFRYSSKVEILGKVLHNERHVLMSVFIVAVFYIFVTALVMFNVEPHINPYTGGVTFSSFFDALYWATVTLTTVGYGDLCPVTEMGRFISILSSLFGVAIIALPSGVITAGYLNELRKQREK